MKSTTTQSEIERLRDEVDELRREIAGLKLQNVRSDTDAEDQSELDTILRNVPIIVSSLDRNGRFLYVNDRYEEMFGRSPDWVKGRHLTEVAGEPHNTIAKPYVERVLAGETVSFTSKIKAYDNTLRDVQVSYVPKRNAMGEPDGFIAMVEDVTSRSQYESALHDSEARFRSFFNLAAVGMVVAGPEGKLLQVNGRFAQMVGYPTGELCEMRMIELTHPDDRASTMEAMAALLNGRSAAMQLEQRFITKTGEYFWGQAAISSVCDDCNNPAYIVGVIEDITVRKGAEQALREREQYLRTLAETLPQLVWTCLPDGRCDYLSRQWVAYTGIPESEQLGLAWLSLIHPDDRDHTATAWARAVEGKAPYDLEYRLRCFDGTYRWFKTRGTPVYGQDGHIARWFGTCTDVDEQRRAAEERTELLKREQRARALAEVLNRVGPMLVSELDSQRLMQKVTDLATGLVRAEFGSLFHNVSNEAGESYMLYTLSGVAPEKFAAFPMPRATALFGITFRGEDTLVLDDVTTDPRYGLSAPYFGMPEGHLPVRSYLAVPVTSRSGQVLGGLFFGHSRPAMFNSDDAELVKGIAAQAAIALDNARLFATSQRTQEALERSNDDLKRANTDLEQFAFAAAHDLQEPLRMLTTYTQLLERSMGDKLDTRTRDYMGYIVSGARRMSLLLQDLLAYTEASRDTDGQLELVDLNRALAQSLRNLEVTIGENGADIVSAELPTLRGRSAHFIQLFQNLIGNAMKYAKPGTKAVVRITVSSEEDHWLLKVIDNGMGIDAAYHKHVFGVFRRLHGSEIAGTGIGLAICQRVVERAGGKIWVESAPDEGATFCFTLPKLQ